MEEGKLQNLNKEGNSKNGDGFLIDRSKVRILMCDNDSKSSQEVFTLLLKCSYQVISVRSARQVIDALNAEGPDIDIILAEVDLPRNKGMKMLKYIAQDKELQHIPVIMMSAQDEVSTVVKCLRLGAADYLVKPLRTNELLNLWTHVWRRQRMLGLVEMNILNYDFDRVASDPSDANTNSTTLFSDDTDDKSRKKTTPEMGISTHKGDEAVAISAAAVVDPWPGDQLECSHDVPGINDHQRGQLSSGPKKSELKIGESSAFFTYVKPTTVRNSSQGFTRIKENAVQNLRVEEKVLACGQPVVNDAQFHENGGVWERYSQGDDFRSSTSVPSSHSLERSCTPPGSREFPHGNCEENLPQVQALMHSRHEPQLDALGLSLQSVYPYYMSGVVNQIAMPSLAQLFQKNLHELQSHATSAILPQFNHLPQCNPGGMASFPYYPVSVSFQPTQMPAATHSWPSFGSTPSSEVKLNKLDRREAALIKFRRKRKERCFDKKIRYVNRKKLAERRPRVRGQFVRKVNGVNVDLNGLPTPTDYDEYEDDDEDEQASRDSYPEVDAS